MTYDIEHIFICLSAICLSSLVRCMLGFFTDFLIGLSISLLLNFTSYLYVLGDSPLPDMPCANIFLPVSDLFSYSLDAFIFFIYFLTSRFHSKFVSLLSWWKISFHKPPDIFAYFRFDRTIEKLRPSSSLALVQERQKWLEREASLWQLWDEQVNQSFRGKYGEPVGYQEMNRSSSL